MAGVERIDRGHLGRVLQLTLLAPDIVEGILGRRQLSELGSPTLMEPVPADRDERERGRMATTFTVGRRRQSLTRGRW
jgi:hypothetical protein